MSTAERLIVTHEDYLKLEQNSDEKHEWYEGKIWAMGGASDRNISVSLNLAMQLKQQHKGGPCKTYIADMLLRVETIDAYFYPDVMMTCSQADHANSHEKSNPLLVVEVLSPSTEKFDRGQKFAAYRTLTSLVHYWLIDSDKETVECYQRQANDEWLFHAYNADDGVITIDNPTLSVNIYELFEE